MANINNNLLECTELDQCLAKYLLVLDAGEKIPSTREFAELMDASLGSISTAMNKNTNKLPCGLVYDQS